MSDVPADQDIESRLNMLDEIFSEVKDDPHMMTILLTSKKYLTSKIKND